MSEWSSDVCSSDLAVRLQPALIENPRHATRQCMGQPDRQPDPQGIVDLAGIQQLPGRGRSRIADRTGVAGEHGQRQRGALTLGDIAERRMQDQADRDSDTRRVGNECVSMCRYWWSLYIYKQKSIRN